MDSANRVQIQDEADCISHSINTLEKSMNLIILPPVMDKYQDSMCALALVRQPVWEKKNSELKPVITPLKKFDLMSHPAHEEGLGKYILQQWI